jgi:SAM-dependent methyltransferase
VSGPAGFDVALRHAGAGHRIVITLHDERGGEHRLDPAAWCGDDIPGDASILARCTGPTLDVGCGPGRLVAALTRQGCPALGIDISAVAVQLTRQRSAPAVRRDVYAPVPGHGRWRRLLLADGNIGIGGDPHRLLRRCRDLVAPDGQVLVEVTAPGTRSWSGPVTIRPPAGAPSTPFRWASVALPDLAALATATALRILETWTEAGRWFASMGSA